jgi:hypothetical protein
MKRLTQFICLCLVAGAAVMGRSDRPATSDEAARASAVKLFRSLTDEQKKLAMKPVDDKERYVEQFPAVERPGLSFDKLSAEQKALTNDVVRAMTSRYGAERCLEVAKQTPDNRRYITFFGEPEKDARFAWRMAEHHLTLVYAEFGADPENEFGPILLGGNPVNKLWDDEENLVMELAKALTPDEAKAVQGKGNAGSGAAIGMAGVRIGDLKDKAQALARKLLDQRLAVFSDNRRQVLDKLVGQNGGVENRRIALSGDAAKSHREGGNCNWKIGGPSVLCDWQTVGKNHIHMTVRGKSKPGG